jgi:hypothetical protein
MARPEQLRAEETVRTLSAAANAVRLYPPTSLLPAQAVDRFLAAARGDASSLQLTVEPAGFKYGDTPLAEGQANVIAFAESLYAHQVGKLIIAPGLTAEEVMAFLRCVAGDPHVAKDAGGLRAVLKQSSITHVAVIEVTLRASTDEGLSGLDLTTAPLEEIAPRLATAALAWQQSAADGPGDDGVAKAVGGLEQAARDLAAQRVAEALMRLDEETRVRALAAAYATDADGRPMEGMLDVVARMKPAALARLLTLAAGQGAAPANELLAGLKLPPEALRAVMLLLTPSPRPEEACGVMGEPNVGLLAAEAVSETEADTMELERQITASTKPVAAKALRTTVELATQRHTAESVQAIGEALGPAVRAGSLASVRAALSYLGSLSSDPQLSGAAAQARQALADPELLRICIGSLTDGADSDIVREGRAVTVQALGGTGGLKVGADFLRRFAPTSQVWISDPSWENHRALFEGAGFVVNAYAYYDAAKHGVDFDGMIGALDRLAAGTIVELGRRARRRAGT